MDNNTFYKQDKILHRILYTANMTRKGSTPADISSDLLKILFEEMKATRVIFYQILQKKQSIKKLFSFETDKSPYPEQSPSIWIKKTLKDEPYKVIDDFSEEIRITMTESGIKSVLIVPVYRSNTLWGFIELQDCIENRVWTEQEKGMVIITASVIGNILNMISMEKKVKESERKYRKLFSNMTQGVIILKLIHDSEKNLKDFSIQDINSVAKKTFKNTALAKNKGCDFFTPEEKKLFLEILKNAEKTKKTFKTEITLQSQRVIDLVAYMISKNQIAFVTQDITAKKKLEEELKTYASIDELTGIFNRRVGISLLEKEIMQSQRRNSPLSIIYIDINGLKNTNDRFGHSIGDELITNATKIIKKCARKSDIIFRMGGDEFLIILPDCKAEKAEVVWKRIRNECDQFNKNSDTPYKISMSHGTATYSGEQTIDEFVNQADSQMYKEKILYKKETEKSSV
ncbi:MAG TPA: sensor domain-containing diguanylate cyclase [Petrotogaceae bacterium]|jgi:diguanylate cyclase (GGDEF)-like protein|nr:sensor domain-containing diguanylate cyclase [Petrotogaceae bacterium]HQF32787.1 sensor domain-containing diguanylate cyclase [Petrotogaceae bacterium]HQH32150.1 sensor domain-containing diguanylate cyclase [Petrotogaceae bacterium]HQI78769.1 sensor domain-containing diguanylate cyclase [Petrotogaceae bacterium]